MLLRHFIDKRFPAFVLAPQTATEHYPRDVLPLVDEVIRKYSIDDRRIYVVGQSLGGYGALDVMAARPRQFAAAVIIATGGSPADVKDLSSIPMWFFHGERDNVIPVAEARAMVRALKTAGGRPRYTEYQGEEHGLAWLVVREREVVTWLYAQRRSQR
jgi:predicted peptidase